MRGCIGLIVILALPGAIAAWALQSWAWIILGPVVFIAALLLAAAFGGKREVTPEEFAAELEQHLEGTEGPHDWDDTTSISLADARLEALRARLVPEYDYVDTPEKRDQLRNIIDALKRGDIPD